MTEQGVKNPNADLTSLGIEGLNTVYWNLSPKELIDKTLELDLGELADNEALVVDTGEFTGRAPNDRYIVRDEVTDNTVSWGPINKEYDSAKFDVLYDKMMKYFSGRDVYVRDAYACADPKYRLNIRVVNELPWKNLFINNLFLRPTEEEIKTMDPDWVIIAAPDFRAVPEIDGTNGRNFVILNFSRKVILIGGTAYAGEMKKSIFSILNYILPLEKNVLSMHCSANVGRNGDTAIFFGLSGTGKTTLSADPNRSLIGDDEHGWSEESVFNFEGGCYAKCINLSKDTEPQIFDAIKYGTILENVKFFDGTNKIDYTETSKTENTRAAYPIYHIDNAKEPSVGPTPTNIFFLTCDAFGVLPPISRLNARQAMYHFISGYTAKVAGTEAGITEPKLTFSACFGAPFLPLHPTKYAEMLGEKIRESNVKVWLVNTGWTGGPYGTGERMSLPYTRATITAALKGELDNVETVAHPVFGLAMPVSCPGVPAELLNPRNTWSDADAYDNKANDLAKSFVENFEQYASAASEEILAAAPKITVNA
ncbi:MAG: phosphoenolpyruvate carboxykinase (ATP) [Bacteroidetes bacterium]|nr:phosphoenolpyruvate carboxykinase (ATP) [Bacteroidota bacterium]